MKNESICQISLEISKYYPVKYVDFSCKKILRLRALYPQQINIIFYVNGKHNKIYLYPK